jgi:hypothetical protein
MADAFIASGSGSLRKGLDSLRARFMTASPIA